MPTGLVGWVNRRVYPPRLTAGVPHAHFVRGPSPVMVLVEEASYKVAAPGLGLSAGPAARETLCAMLPLGLGLTKSA